MHVQCLYGGWVPRNGFVDMCFMLLLPVFPVLHFVAPCKRGAQGAGAGWESGLFMRTPKAHRVKYSHVGTTLTVKVYPV